MIEVGGQTDGLESFSVLKTERLEEVCRHIQENCIPDGN